MEESEVYNLKPLRLVLLGLIISTISIDFQMEILLFEMEYSNIVVISSVIKIIGWGIAVLGLRNVRGYSKFDKCYKVALCIFAIMVIGIMVGIILFVAIIMFFYYLFKSIEEIAEQLGENRLAKITDKIWMVSVWMFIFNSCIMLIVSIATAFFVQNIIMDIVTIVPSIICFVICVFIYKATKILDGREIPILVEQKEEI